MRTEPKPESPAELAAIDEWSLAKATEVMNRSYPGGFAQLKAAIQVALIEACKSSIQASASASQPVAEVNNIGMLKATPHGTRVLKAGDQLYTAATQARPASGEAWISVEERLPPACTEVIARGRPYGTRKEVLLCEFRTYISTRPRECVEDEEITHWHPAAPTSTPSENNHG